MGHVDIQQFPDFTIRVCCAQLAGPTVTWQFSCLSACLLQQIAHVQLPHYCGHRNVCRVRLKLLVYRTSEAREEKMNALFNTETQLSLHTCGAMKEPPKCMGVPRKHVGHSNDAQATEKFE